MERERERVTETQREMRNPMFIKTTKRKKSKTNKKEEQKKAVNTFHNESFTGDIIVTEVAEKHIRQTINLDWRSPIALWIICQKIV